MIKEEIWEQYLIKAGEVNPDGSHFTQMRRIRNGLEGHIGMWKPWVWIIP